MKKAVSAIVLCVLLIISMSLSVFADPDPYTNPYARFSPTRFMVSKTSDYYSGLVDVPFSHTYTESVLTVTESGGSFQRYGWMAEFTSFNNFVISTSSEYLLLDVTVQDKTSSGYLDDYSNYFEKVFITLSDDRYYEIVPNVAYLPETNQYSFRFITKVTTEVPDLHIDLLSFYCNIPSGSQGWAKYDIDFELYLYYKEFTAADLNNQVINEINTSTQQIVSSINGQTQEIKDSIEASTGQITDKIQNSTDQITGEIQDGADQIAGSIDGAVSEDFGYEDSVAQGDAEAGIADLKTQIDSLSSDISQSVDDFKVSIDGLSDSMDRGKSFIWGWLDFVPIWFTAVVVGLAGLLIARKIVK